MIINLEFLPGLWQALVIMPFILLVGFWEMLIPAGASLLGSLISGGQQKSQEQRTQQQTQQYLEQMKPDVPYYQTQNMPGMDYLLANAVMNTFNRPYMQNLFPGMGGGQGGMGGMITDLLQSMNLTTPFSALSGQFPQQPGRTGRVSYAGRGQPRGGGRGAGRMM